MEHCYKLVVTVWHPSDRDVPVKTCRLPYSGPGTVDFERLIDDLHKQFDPTVTIQLRLEYV